MGNLTIRKPSIKRKIVNRQSFGILVGIYLNIAGI